MVQNPLLPKEYKAAGAITKQRIVKFDAADGEVVQAAAATDLLLGVAAATAASGDRVRVDHEGIVQVEAGGAITRGDYVTSDANGKAVAAAPGAGVNNSVIGRALVTAANADIFPVLLGLSRVQG